VIRTHWEIENRVHWVLDVAMGEDINRIRKGESAQNLALMRKLALNLLRHEHSVPVGIAAKQKRAGWDHDYLLKILSQTCCDCPVERPSSGRGIIRRAQVQDRQARLTREVIAE